MAEFTEIMSIGGILSFSCLKIIGFDKIVIYDEFFYKFLASTSFEVYNLGTEIYMKLTKF